MKQNMGLIDRSIRILIAVIIGLLFLFDIISGVPAVILLVLAAIFIATSFIGFCPLYVPFKISTKGKN